MWMELGDVAACSHLYMQSCHPKGLSTRTEKQEGGSQVSICTVALGLDGNKQFSGKSKS